MKRAYLFAAIVVAVSVLPGVPGCDNRSKVIDGIEFVWVRRVTS
jgi:hypothetical protein